MAKLLGASVEVTRTKASKCPYGIKLSMRLSDTQPRPKSLKRFNLSISKSLKKLF